jgi:hypothetical protein
MMFITDESEIEQNMCAYGIHSLCFSGSRSRTISQPDARSLSFKHFVFRHTPCNAGITAWTAR